MYLTDIVYSFLSDACRCEPFSTYPRTYDLIHVDDIENLVKDPNSGKTRYFVVLFCVKLLTIQVTPSFEKIFRLHCCSSAIELLDSMFVSKDRSLPFSVFDLKQLYHCRCNLVDLMVEIDRILRPEGTVIIRDSPEVIDKMERISRAMRWRVSVHDKEPDSHQREKVLVATKKLWKRAGPL